ncbi:hypothetical protein [Streptomyces sp. NPDC051636]|uniref:hypothetical protein n=1 Tax=Streptomyces sp. NPDC051636 TaxID=3365663 RepID=UPI0037BA866D
MIRAGRQHLVRTSELLAQDMGMALGTFRNRKPYTAAGFPAPISSAGARVLLWDSEQTDAYFAGEPVPELPQADSDQDMLDRQEAAAELHVTPRTWDGYKKDPRIAPYLVTVCGVEHCPRAAVRDFKAFRPGKQAATGRPKGSKNAISSTQLPGQIAVLLDVVPDITIHEVCDQLGVAYGTAQRGLAKLRSDRIADLMKAVPELSFEQAADRLGYPAMVRRAARDVTRRG